MNLPIYPVTGPDQLIPWALHPYYDLATTRLCTSHIIIIVIIIIIIIIMMCRGSLTCAEQLELRMGQASAGCSRRHIGGPPFPPSTSRLASQGTGGGQRCVRAHCAGGAVHEAQVLVRVLQPQGGAVREELVQLPGPVRSEGSRHAARPLAQGQSPLQRPPRQPCATERHPLGARAYTRCAHTP